MEISSDPYEQKLYQMFQSYDNESNGSLDETALVKLCKTLELKEKSKILVKCLLDDNNKEKVTFREFKDGLLKFLGNEMTETHDQLSSTSIENHLGVSTGNNSPLREVSPKFIVGSKKYGRRSRPQYNEFDEYSLSESDNEQIAVVPSTTNKYVKSNKVQRSASQSDIHGNKRRRPVGNTKLKRCASLPAQRLKKEININEILPQKLDSSLDSLGNLDFENLSQNLYENWIKIGNKNTNYYLNHKELIIVCKMVGLNKIASKIADEVYEKLNLTHKSRVGFNDFISLIQNDTEMIPANFYNNYTTLEICDENDVNSNVEDDSHETASALSNESTIVPSDVIIDMWESAGISHANSLLSTLGFSKENIQISDLSNALDEELHVQNAETTEISPMLRASLALHKAEVNALRQAIRQLGAENRKLYSDNKDANRRAAILAQEIDERHATLENSTKSEIRILEQRHAEIIRELTAQLSTERENWSTLNSRLETRIKLLENEEIKLKNELVLMNDDKCALETEQISLQKQLTELLESNITLNNELAEYEEKYKTDENFKTDIENEEVLELIEKISNLQMENSNLRDKNDELSAEIEGLNVEMVRFKSKKHLNRSASAQEPVTTTLTDIDDNIVPPIEIEPNQCVAVKRRGDSPSKTRVTEESPRLGKLRKCNADENTGTESETSGDWMALNSELCQTILTTPATASSTSGFSQDFSSLNENSTKDEELKNMKIKIQQLEKELEEFRAKLQNIPHDITNKITPNLNEELEKLKSEKTKLEKSCEELENCLEQMRKEYEDCEDYWQSKLSEERQLYEEEQRMSDEKLNDLLRKMAEYEEQFAIHDKNGRLTPIEENSRLEQQFSELEAENDEIKMRTRKLLEEKEYEMNCLNEKIKLLEQKLQENDLIVNTSPPPRDTPDVDSPASSPISYLWSQSTIHGPARDYTNPNWNRRIINNGNSIDPAAWGLKVVDNNIEEQLPGSITRTVSPIQKPFSDKGSDNGKELGDNSDAGSVKSIGSHSVASTYNIIKSPICHSPDILRDEINRLKMSEVKLKDEIRELCLQRDGFVMELQQLQEAKSVLEKAYVRAAHPGLTSKIQQLEQRNRHLQNSLRQQTQYVETIMHQNWQQQRAEIHELRNRIETQNMIISDQAQRLTNADLLVKDLYVENSHLTATIQRLEQQRNRGLLQLQHPQGINGMTGPTFHYDQPIL